MVPPYLVQNCKRKGATLTIPQILSITHMRTHPFFDEKTQKKNCFLCTHPYKSKGQVKAGP